MTQDDILAIVRHVLTAAGAGLVTNGTLSADQLQTIIGGILALGMVGWSLIQKSQQRKAVAVALNTPAPNAPSPDAPK